MELPPFRFSPTENPRLGHLIAQISGALNISDVESQIAIEKARMFFHCYPRYVKSRKPAKSLLMRIISGKDMLESRVILRFLRIWILELFSRDFKRNSLEILLIFIREVGKRKPELKDEINRVKLALIKKSKARQSNLFLIELPTYSRPLTQFSPGEVADHLTLIDSQYLATLSLSEFTCKEKSIALSKMEERVNNISYWVASNILTQRTTSSQVKVIRYFLSIAQLCEQLGNLHSTNAIMVSLYLNPIQRLAKIWSSKLDHNSLIMLGNLKQMVDSKDNYLLYRDILHKRDIIIPNLMIFKRDFSMADEGNPDYLKNRINGKKFDLLISLLSELSHYQTLAAKFTLKAPDRTLLAHLKKLNRWTYDHIERRSEEIRPRENSSSIDYSDISHASSDNSAGTTDDLIDVSTEDSMHNT